MQKKAIVTGQQTRPPMERMQRIFRILKEGVYPSRIDLAQEIEVTTKTIQRDVDFMRDRLNLPIAFDRDKGGYGFTAPVEAFPMLELTEDEIISVLVVQKALGQFKGTPFESPLRSAFEKLTSGLKGKMTLLWGEFDSMISFRHFDLQPSDMTTFRTVSKAIQEGMILEFEYKKLTSAEYELRKVEPYHLACLYNQWYCFSYDLKRKEIRAFVLARMKSPQITEEKILKPKPFSIDDYLKGSLGVFNAKGNHHIRIQFDAFASQLVRERKWHPSQEIKELGNDCIEFSIKLTSFEEIEPWVLSWGKHAKVIAPEGLRKRLYNIANIQINYFNKNNI